MAKRKGPTPRRHPPIPKGLERPRVFYAFPTNQQMMSNMTMSLLRVREAPWSGPIFSFMCGPNMKYARNEITKEWLLKHSDMDYMLMLDNDIVFNADIVAKMVLDMDEHPEWGAIAPFMVTYREGTGVKTVSGFWDPKKPVHYFRFECVPPPGYYVDVASGGACMLIRKTAMEEVMLTHPNPWNYETGLVAEDVAMCWRLHENGTPMVLNSELHVGHMRIVMMTPNMVESRPDEEERVGAMRWVPDA